MFGPNVFMESRILIPVCMRSLRLRQFLATLIEKDPKTTNERKKNKKKKFTSEKNCQELEEAKRRIFKVQNRIGKSMKNGYVECCAMAGVPPWKERRIRKMRTK